MLELKEYQKRSLAALESYLCLAATAGDKMAFLHHTERPYRSVPQLPGLPYICLRSQPAAARRSWHVTPWASLRRNFFRPKPRSAFWLVPSNTIREQTLAALAGSSAPIPSSG